MKVIGVTGGIGMGKSACAALLRERGVWVLDTDDLARELVRPGEPALQAIIEAFDPGVLDASGKLNRGALALRVFGNETDRKRLEAILHPAIREKWRQQIGFWTEQGHALAAVIIPLLFETGARRDFDATLCVACSVETQRERLLQRGWSGDDIKHRVSAQWSAERKMELSDYVIWSEGSMELHAAQLERVLSGFEMRHQAK